METSPFARLSAELRNEIYAYALYMPEGVWLNDETDEEKSKPIGKLRLQASGDLTALTMTCRQIHAEAGLLFYSINKFFIRPLSLGYVPPFLAFNRLPWLRRFRAWMNTVGSSNASCITKLCLHVGNYPTWMDPDDINDYVSNILPMERRAWLESMHPSLNFALDFFDPESSNSTDHGWVPTSFELPLHDRSEAKRRIDMVFDEKLIRLRGLLERLEGEISPEQEKEIGDARKQGPQVLKQSDVPHIEMSIQDIRDNISDVKRWRRQFFGIILEEYFLYWDEPELLDHDSATDRQGL